MRVELADGGASVLASRTVAQTSRLRVRAPSRCEFPPPTGGETPPKLAGEDARATKLRRSVKRRPPCGGKKFVAKYRKNRQKSASAKAAAGQSAFAEATARHGEMGSFFHAKGEEG